ncbi:MAG: DNA-binding protein [Saprospiraceae bacterium]|nr:DNA-binding protein [Saprospiraceae bacterium]
MKYSLILLAFLGLQCTTTKSAMQHDEMKIHAFRLKPGEDLRAGIEAFAKQENIEAGWVMTCVGSLTQTNLRFANQPSGAKANGHFEIVGLTGTVSVNGCHLHLSVSDSLGQTTGGHLLPENLVYTTAEIVLGESRRHVFTREKDGTTPWEELQVRKRD